jgi:hypothetical protein
MTVDNFQLLQALAAMLGPLCALVLPRDLRALTIAISKTLWTETLFISMTYILAELKVKQDMEWKHDVFKLALI